MRFVSEYRDAGAARALADAIAADCRGEWSVMEVCGGQTHAIMRFGIDRMLPDGLRLVHGPGCPVCVTPVGLIDAAIGMASLPDVILCSFGDMMRVPGSGRDLLGARASGADVRMVYSPLDAVSIAAGNRERQVVFFAVGFETTAPVTAAAVLRAEAMGLDNFTLLPAHVLVLPAMEAVLGMPGTEIEGFLAAGHVCTVTGYEDYGPLARDHGVPVVVTGFEPLDILEGLHMCVRMLEEGTPEVRNQYRRSVTREGNRAARAIVERVFRVTDRSWRGMGTIPRSGLSLSGDYAGYDAAARFGIEPEAGEDAGECMAGLVLTGRASPDECPAFGAGCTPEHPLGAPMVSSEGACAAYHRYGRGGQVPG